MSDRAGRILAPQTRLMAPLLADWPGQANPGLVFDRFLPIWGPGKTPRLLPLAEPLGAFAEAVAGHAAGTLPGNLLEDLHRRQDLFLQRPGPGRGEARQFRTVQRLATGLGAEHATENGFALDHLIGVPVLRGSGLKGLCRATASLFEDLGERDRRRLFGSAFPPGHPRKEDKERGDICFFDAYPTTWPRLEVDVTNVHHRDYYGGLAQGDGSQGPPPLETESPVPVFFLTVAPGTAFAVRLWSRSGDDGLLQLAWDCLAEGMDWLGCGAKTAVGYGCLVARSEGTEWLDRTLEELRARHRMPDSDTALRGQALAAAWQAIPDPAVKAQVLAEIERRWRARGWWQNPAKSQRKVMQVYQPEKNI